MGKTEEEIKLENRNMHLKTKKHERNFYKNKPLIVF